MVGDVRYLVGEPGLGDLKLWFLANSSESFAKTAGGRETKTRRLGTRTTTSVSVLISWCWLGHPVQSGGQLPHDAYPRQWS